MLRTRTSHLLTPILVLALLADPALATESVQGVAVVIPQPPAPSGLQLLLEQVASPTGTAHAVGPETLRQFYAHHGFAPVWNTPGRLQALVAQLLELEHDGLRPDDYGVQQLMQWARDAVPLAECDDVLASRAYLQAIAHLHHGRLDPERVEPLWRASTVAPRRSGPAPALIAASAADIDDLAGSFARARPSLPLYQALRSALKTLDQRQDIQDWKPLPSGPSLRPGERSARVPLLRARLAETFAAQGVGDMPNSEVYDDALVAAVIEFQSRHQLETDGIVGPATLAALNVSPAEQRDKLRINLERLRWLAAELQDHMVLVDVAGAMIRYYRDGTEQWQARTQVGRANRPTPLLRSEITHFTLNPTWTVPPTILRNDKLPEIRRDPAYLARNRMRVLDRNGRELDPDSIDWSSPGAIMLRQDAGAGNALGRIAIRFPNPYSVYLHDTPSQRLFARDQRAFSSGCVRVENATDLVDLLIADAGSVSPERFHELLDSGRTRNLELAHPVPILVAYWTAGVSEQGTVFVQPDIYKRDPRLSQALSSAPPVLPASTTLTACR